MSPRLYAAQTEVASERTRIEIEDMLDANGARDIDYSKREGYIALSFSLEGRRYRITLPTPRLEEFEYTETGRERALDAARKAHQQAVRAAWRALGLDIKAKFVAINQGIRTVEQQFYADMLIPGTRMTLHEALGPVIQESYSTGKPPLLKSGGNALLLPPPQEEM